MWKREGADIVYMYVRMCDQPTLIQASFHLYVSAPGKFSTGPNSTALVNSFSETGRRMREDTGRQREEGLTVTVIEWQAEEDMSNHRAKLRLAVLLLTDCYSGGRPNNK